MSYKEAKRCERPKDGRFLRRVLGGLAGPEGREEQVLVWIPAPRALLTGSAEPTSSSDSF